MNREYLILDCFVDEPACFGVPPFISPYPRYIYGALLDAGVPEESITYHTIDYVRHSAFLLPQPFDAVFLVGGAVVPGKYLGQKIGTESEIMRIIMSNPRSHFISNTLLGQMLEKQPDNLRIVGGDVEHYAWSMARGAGEEGTRTYDNLNRWACAGSRMPAFHPDYPHIICEIESYRGCPRSSHCSFCSEALFDGVTFRQQTDILAEIDALVEQGVSRFRIGRQADILAYKCDMSSFSSTFPRPNPQEVISLFQQLGSRRQKGKIRVLNVDNANPGTIAHYPRESQKILAAIADAVSPGDTLPLGIESFDPAVIQRNNLKIDRNAFLRVASIMNEAGSAREGGIPKLLPGVNLIHGLPGETPETFRINYEALHDAADAGILLKRINIRTVIPMGSSPVLPVTSRSVTSRYRYYRDRIRHEIDQRMLKEIYPPGSVLHDVQWLESRGDYMYGRQIASYAITVKMWGDVPKKTFSDAVVCGYGVRSVTGFIPPLRINGASHQALSSVTGIGKKRAVSLIYRRPFTSADDVNEYLQSVPSGLLPYICL